MTTPTQVAVNSAAVLAAAARLEHAGYEGDAAAFIEGLLLEAIRSGYKPVEPVPALRGPASTERGRQAAHDIWEAAKREKASNGR